MQWAMKENVEAKTLKFNLLTKKFPTPAPTEIFTSSSSQSTHSCTHACELARTADASAIKGGQRQSHSAGNDTPDQSFVCRIIRTIRTLTPSYPNADIYTEMPGLSILGPSRLLHMPRPRLRWALPSRRPQPRPRWVSLPPPLEQWPWQGRQRPPDRSNDDCLKAMPSSLFKTDAPPWLVPFVPKLAHQAQIELIDLQTVPLRS
jgi:hypothetical protein